jgi:GT2 family glycosyltransferase
MDPLKTVCAVVVTYNRRDLLTECLRALVAQTQQLARIIVVDNASTDDTPRAVAEFIATSPIPIQSLRLPENGGGAGGFHSGVKAGAATDCEWLWLLDDDTIATPTAVEELLAAHDRFPAGSQPQLVASEVVWSDGTPHPMNQPWLTVHDEARNDLAEDHETRSIRTATFVSLLLRREMVAKYGLPIARYFVWADDIEYTGRILRHEFGVWARRSVVVHKTAQKHSATDCAPHRFYFHVRNSIWMLKGSPAWAPRERAELSIHFLVSIASFFGRTTEKLGGLRSLARGVTHGLKG